ncbi:MAG TPA: ABC transporter permease [Casimicrobiaceae bacterium]|nr:ABC transporter permease [Casimicrobiaceae bacterium]
MSTVPAGFTKPEGEAAAQPVRAATSLSPNQRAWARFKRNRLGYGALIVFLAMLALSTCAELVSNERPLVARYKGEWFFPIVKNDPETRFGGDFQTPTDWNDPFIREQFSRDGNFAVYTLNPYSAGTVNYFNKTPAPAPPSSENTLGTDDTGRDMLARLIYGFRISVWFGVALTAIGVVLGILVGALQGYFGGRIDLTGQRLIEIWNSIPELYLLIIIASIFDPTILLVLVVLALFGWVGLSDYVRAEFLRNRNLEFVKAARALGLSNWQIMWRHVLPNSLTPVITFLPFRMSAAILGLAALEFLGLGPANVPSLGDLLRQGKENLDAWWISVPTFLVLVLTLLLLTFIGDALRDAFDTRKS